ARCRLSSRAMDFSRLDRNRVLLGGVGSIVLIISTLFLPWYSLSHLVGNARAEQGAWICGANDYSCTGFDPFPIMRWFVPAGGVAALVLGWILVRGHPLSWAPGELTMVVGFVLLVLIGYNGLIDKPGTGPQEIGVGLDYGYWLALLASIAIAATGFLRSQVGQKRERKAP